MKQLKETGFPHMFSVKALGKLPGFFKPRRYLYHCARCKWSFVVNDGRRGLLTPIADGIRALNHDEAVARAATFAAGPCPAMRVVVEAHLRRNGGSSNGHVPGHEENSRRTELPASQPMRSDSLARRSGS